MAFMFHEKKITMVLRTHVDIIADNGPVERYRPCGLYDNTRGEIEC